MAGIDWRAKPGDNTIPGTWVPKSASGALTPTIAPVTRGRSYDIGSFATTRPVGEVPGATDFSAMSPAVSSPAPTVPGAKTPTPTKVPMTPKQVGRQAAQTGMRGGAAPRQNATGSRKQLSPKELATQIVMGKDREPGSGVQPQMVGDPTTGYNWKDAIDYAINALPSELRWGSKSPAKYAAMSQVLGHLLGAASQSFGSEVGAKSQFAGQQVNANASFANNQLDLAGKLQQDKTTAAHNKDWLGIEQGKLTEDKRQANLANALGWYTAKTGRMNAGRSADDPFLTKLYADALKDSKNPVTSMNNFRKAAGLYLGTHKPIESDTFTLGGARVKLAGAVHKKNYNEYQGLTQQLYDLTNIYNQDLFRDGKAKAELDKRRAAIFSRMKELGVTTTPVDDDLTALADGGPMEAGKKYLVGESGPEVITAKTDGQVTPIAPKIPTYEQVKTPLNVEDPNLLGTMQDSRGVRAMYREPTQSPYTGRFTQGGQEVRLSPMEGGTYTHETRAALNTARDLGLPAGQGNHLGAPLTSTETRAFWNRWGGDNPAPVRPAVPTSPAYGGLKVAPMPVANPFGPGVLDQKPLTQPSPRLFGVGGGSYRPSQWFASRFK